jgi:hypothetical protein
MLFSKPDSSAKKKPTKSENIGYVVKAVSKPHSNFRFTRKGMVIAGVMVGNLVLLLGFMGFYSSINSQLIPNNEALNTISEFTRSGITANIPLLDGTSLRQFSTDREFPLITSSEPEVEEQFQSLVTNQGIFSQETTENPPLPTIADTDWNITGAGLLNGDENQDLVWTNNEVNSNLVWFMDETEVTGIKSFPTIKDTRWQLQLVNDFNSDGFADFLWREQRTGAADTYLLWDLRDGSVVREQWVEVLVDGASEWDIMGSSDFDGNGVEDIVFRYRGEDPEYQGANLVHYFEMDGEDYIPRRANPIRWLPWLNNSRGEEDSSQSLIDIKDFNFDGFPDVIWRTGNTTLDEDARGEILVWIMNDEERLTIMRVPVSKDEAWDPTFVDIDNNGSYDIVWRNDGRDASDQCSAATSVWLLSSVFRLTTSLEEEIQSC